jgi:Tfp pilus assembly protein PilF
LIFATIDQHLMSETYESDLGDVLKLQREVAESITKKVRARLTTEEEAPFQETRKLDPEAYEMYLASTYLSLDLDQELKAARSYLQKAIQRDPNFPLAYDGLAWTYVAAGEDRLQSPQEAYLLAKDAVHKALELDEKNCQAHTALGLISWRYDWDWKTAEAEFHRAVELGPNSRGAHYSMGWYLAFNGRVAESKAEAVKLRELDPIQSEFLRSEGIINYHLRNYPVSSHPTCLQWCTPHWVIRRSPSGTLKPYQIRSKDRPYFLRADLRLDSLRPDPRFQNLLRRMNFPQ